MPSQTPDQQKTKMSPQTAKKRWTDLLNQATEALTTRRDEMQEYFDERSESWQEGEKGAEFQERIDALDSILEELSDLDAE